MAAVPIDGLASPCDHALSRAFDFRGRFGQQGVALFVGADAAALRAFNLTAVPTADLRGPADWRVWALVAREALKPADEVAVRSRYITRPHATVRDVTFALLADHDVERDWPAGIEDIPVPRRAVRLAGRFEDSPAYPFVSKRAFNDLIAAAVARVSQEELYATDDYISSEEIFTRQSASEGLLVAGEYLQSRLRAYGLAVSTFAYNANYGPVIVAELTGRVPDQFVIVGAHYDSRTTNSADPTARAPGADDNGSGTSAIVELARVMTSANVSYEFSVRFLLFSGEEQGLLGSNAYADYLVEQGTEVLAMFNGACARRGRRKKGPGMILTLGVDVVEARAAADMLGYRIPGNPIEMGMKDQYITEWLLEESFAISAQYVPDMPVKLSSSCCSGNVPGKIERDGRRGALMNRGVESLPLPLGPRSGYVQTTARSGRPASPRSATLRTRRLRRPTRTTTRFGGEAPVPRAHMTFAP